VAGLGCIGFYGVLQGVMSLQLHHVELAHRCDKHMFCGTTWVHRLGTEQP
jgi:hypothetical protein